MTSLSIEIIMNDTPEHDAKAKDNGARIVAWLMWKNKLPMNALVTHTYWVNKSAGNRFNDVDVQCCNPVKNKKWCPSYIFASSNADIALKNWKAFKQLVKTYIEQLEKVAEPASDVLYKVQMGAFKNKANAEALAEKLKKDGYDTYITTTGA